MAICFCCDKQREHEPDGCYCTKGVCSRCGLCTRHCYYKAEGLALHVLLPYVRKASEPICTRTDASLVLPWLRD